MKLLVWILVVVHSGQGATTQLGPFADLPSCQRAQEAVMQQRSYIRPQCVQVNVVMKP